MSDDLQSQAEAFATTLTSLLNATVCDGAQLDVTLLPGGSTALVSPVQRRRAVNWGVVDLVGSGSPSRLGIKMFFRVRLDSHGRHLAVDTSSFGLCVNKQTGNCAVRIDYDRGEGSEPDKPDRHSRSAAHVHLNGASAEIGYARALCGYPPLPLDKLHLPVGGRRMRPTLEDFIEFLVSEHLAPEPKPDWWTALATSRAEWVSRQVRATVRRAPEDAIAQLEDMGYTVTRPAADDPV